MTRLSTTAPNLVRLIEQAGEEKRQAVKLAACLFIMPSLTEVDQDLLQDVRNLLLVGQIGSPELLEKLENLAWSFDEKYLPLKERSEYLHYFIHARGLTALWLALKNNSFESTCDSIYEVGHAANQLKGQFFLLIRALLS